jgi:hypothetical protein
VTGLRTVLAVNAKKSKEFAKHEHGTKAFLLDWHFVASFFSFSREWNLVYTTENVM